VVAKARGGGGKHVARYTDAEMQVEWGGALAQYALDVVATKRGQQICVFFIAHREATVTLVVSHGNALDVGLFGGALHVGIKLTHAP
jgi:hypothetical protein